MMAEGLMTMKTGPGGGITRNLLDREPAVPRYRWYTYNCVSQKTKEIQTAVQFDYMKSVGEALEAIKARIITRYEGKIEATVIEESFQKIEDKYLLGNDDVYEKVERFLCANVLRVPHHVLLPEDQVLLRILF